MNLKYLKSVVVADSYAAMHPYMMKEYFQNFEKEKRSIRRSLLPTIGKTANTTIGS